MATKPSNKKTVRKKEPTYNQHPYTCVKCGFTTDNPTDKFYKSSYSNVYKFNSQYVPICKSCVRDLYVDYRDKYGSERMAFKLCCHHVDIPFVNSIFNTVMQRHAQKWPDSVFGYYLKAIAINQFEGMTFNDSIIDLSELSMDNQTIRRVEESMWSEADLQNMESVKSTFGYDPFESDVYLDDDRKFLFNMAAGFCDDESIRNNTYLLNKLIVMVKNELHQSKLNDAIAREQNQADPNQDKIRSLAVTQKNLQANVKDVAPMFMANSSGAGSNTLSEKTKKMLKDDFTGGEVNLHDVKTSEAIRQIDKISLLNITNSFDGNDWNETLTEQCAYIEKINRENDDLQEQLRLSLNELAVVKAKLEELE